MNFPRYVVFGEALTDFILQPDQRWIACPGGSCWNVARAGARCGVPTAFAGTVSQDVFGDALFSQAQQAGLDMRFMRQLPHTPLLAMVPSTRPPQYFFVGDDSADLHFDPAALPAGWMDAVEIAHFGCISLARQPLAGRLLQVARELAAAGKRIAFDPNFRSPMADPAYRATLVEMASMAHFIKVSDEDLTGLFPGRDVRTGLAELRRLAPRAALLLTRGAEGMTLFQDGRQSDQRVFAVDVKDTVGCGDTAMGGWMASQLLYPDADPAWHLRYAAASAACTAAHDGAYPPSAEEVLDLMKQPLTIGTRRREIEN
jgi:fructokinase